MVTEWVAKTMLYMRWFIVLQDQPEKENQLRRTFPNEVEHLQVETQALRR